MPARCVVLLVQCPGPLGSCSPVCLLGALFCLCSVLGHLAPVHRGARVVRCFACAVSWATWLLFTGVPAWCVVLLVQCPGPLGSWSPVCALVCCVACVVSWATWLLFTAVPARCVALRLRCPGPLGSCSPVCPLGALFCLCGVLGNFAPVHPRARSVCGFACAVSWATWLLVTAVRAWFVVLRVWCPGPLGSCSPLCPVGVLCCVCGVLGHLAPVHQCARSVDGFACAVSWATWLLFTGVPAWCVVLLVRCPGPLGSCSPVCPRAALCCVCGVLGHLAPVHQCARSVDGFACAVSWATWLPFTGAPAWCVVLLVRCPRPLGSCSPVCPRGLFRCVCGVLGHLAPVHRCARSVCRFASAVSWATWLLFTGLPPRCVVLLVRCPGPLGSCSPVCPLGALLWVCSVLGHLAPVHRCAHFMCCFACAMSWATWLLFSGVPARRVALRVRCPGPLGSCSPVRPRGLLCCMCGVVGHLVPVHRCARVLRCFACAVSPATGLLFTGVPAWFVVLRVRCPGPLGSSSPVCPLGALFCLCGVLGHLAPVHRCARLVRCAACAVSWANWLLFTGVPARCVVLSPLSWATWLLVTSVPAWFVVLRVRCPGPLDSCSPMCPLGVLCCLCGVLGHLAPVHRGARVVRCFVCAVSWATWLLFTGVPAWCVVLLVQCPGPLGSWSPVCARGLLCCVCGVLGHLAPVQRCARLVRCFACAVSWAIWLPFTGVPAWCVVLLVRCPRPLGSCSPVCLLGVLGCVCGVLGHLAPVHRCAPSVCCVVCAVSWAPWLLFTGAAPGVLCGVPRHLAPVHRCARLVRCFACAVSWAIWLPFTGVPAWCVVLLVRCPGPLGSCSPVCLLGVLCCVCGVLRHLAPVHRCARSVCCVACAVSWATWLLFTGPAPGVLCGVLGHLAPVHRFGARCVVLGVACAGRRCAALTRPSGRWLFVAGRGWVPSGRALVHPDGGCS